MDAEGKPLRSGVTNAMVLVPGTEQLGQALRDAATPDLAVTKTGEDERNALGFIHRKLKDSDIYYVVNTSNRSVGVGVTFSTSFKNGRRWDAETGASRFNTVPSFLAPVELSPYESAVFVFAKDAVASPPVPQKRGTDGAPSVVADMTSDWRVAFAGAGTAMSEPVLKDWTSDAATLHYSGEAVYTRDVSIAALPKGTVFLEVEGGSSLPGAPNSAPEHAALGPNGLPDPLVTRTGPGMHAYFEPPVREAALVFINGNAAGALWHPPYRLEVGPLLKAGVNHVEIRVFNTALNAWSALPAHDFGPLKAKYGGPVSDAGSG